MGFSRPRYLSCTTWHIKNVKKSSRQKAALFNIYVNNVSGLLDYYREKNVLYIVRSHALKEDTFADIRKILENQD